MNRTPGECRPPAPTTPHGPGTTPRGRGTGDQPANRFETLHVELDAPERAVPTQFLRDTTRRIIARNDSPDVPFEYSINPYRGCEHGCVYCYARPTHELLGMSAGLDFETRILVKEEGAELLRRELTAPSWEPAVVALSGVTDPYQPVERALGLTRALLEVLAEFRNPVGIVTKSALVTRDLDLLGNLARVDAVCVYLSITTLDARLARDLEPRASSPRRRLDAIRALAAAGIPCGVMVAPVIPGLTDHEIPAILAAAAKAGATRAGTVTLRLPGAVGDLFESWLAGRSPERHRKVMHRVRSLRRGRRNESAFGVRMRGSGPFADQVTDLFRAACARYGFETERYELSTAAFRRPGQAMLPLEPRAPAGAGRQPEAPRRETGRPGRAQ